MVQVKYYLQDTESEAVLADNFDSPEEAVEHANENDISSFLILSTITDE